MPRRIGVLHDLNGGTSGKGLGGSRAGRDVPEGRPHGGEEPVAAVENLLDGIRDNLCRGTKARAAGGDDPHANGRGVIGFDEPGGI